MQINYYSSGIEVSLAFYPISLLTNDTAINLATYFVQPLPKTWRIINKTAGRQVAITLSLITHLRTAIFASVAKSTEKKYHFVEDQKTSVTIRMCR